MAEGYLVEHIDMFEAVAPPESAHVNHDGEVECFECLDLNAIVERLHAGDFTPEAGLMLATWLGRDRR